MYETYIKIAIQLTSDFTQIKYHIMLLWYAISPKHLQFKLKLSLKRPTQFHL